MKIVAVIPHHGGRLRQALDGPDVDAVVVDDSPGGVAPIAGVGWVRTGGEEGFARACNRGLILAEQSGATHVLLLNDDARVLPGCMEALAAAWGSEVGALGPVIEGSRGPEAGIALSRWGRVVVRRQVPSDVEEVDAVSGACMLVASSTRFDERFRHGMEDVELCRRLRAGGLAVRVVPAARCAHEGGASLPRHHADAQRHAVSGHLRLVGGGWRTPVVLGLAAAQVVRERGPVGRLPAIIRGWRDWLRDR